MVVTSFSAYGTDETGGAKPDLVVPGKNIISVLATQNATLPTLFPGNVVGGGNYFKMSGTSVSAPMVSGAVALLLQSEPNLNPDQVKYRLMSTALQKNSRGSWDTRIKWSNYSSTKAGAGLLDIQAAVNNKLMGTTPNTGKPQSAVINSNGQVWASANWSSANWSSANWSSANWSSANWSSACWSC
jgi:serine protease AprX